MITQLSRLTEVGAAPILAKIPEISAACERAGIRRLWVFGSAVRFAVPYLDPKTSDGSPEEAAAYDARSEQIGREMHHVMSRVAARLVGS